MRNKIGLLLLVGALVLNSSMLCLAGMESESYGITRSVLAGGGAFMGSENYMAAATLGQAFPIGPSLSENYVLQAGFWFSVFMKGDVNGDGIIDLADLVLSLQLLAGMSVSDVHRGADVNADGRIGLEEALYILGKAAGLR
jgi:hypothetical protein